MQFCVDNIADHERPSTRCILKGVDGGFIEIFVWDKDVEQDISIAVIIDYARHQ